METLDLVLVMSLGIIIIPASVVIYPNILLFTIGEFTTL